MDIYDSNAEGIRNGDVEIRTLADAHRLHDRMIELRTSMIVSHGRGFIPHYRAEQRFGWDITPGLFRGKGAQLDPLHAKQLEVKAIDLFEQTVRQKLGDKTFRDMFNKTKYGKSWDLLFQAQHGGIHTSLTDWTGFEKMAMFFGTEESQEPVIEGSDAQLWVFMVPEEMLLSDSNTYKNSYLDYDPFNLPQGIMPNVPILISQVEERIFEQRINRQGGRFFISPSDVCNVPLNKQAAIAELLFRFRIPAACKRTIRDELNRQQQPVNRATIYIEENPDVASWIGEINRNIYGF
jgi:hypothetical protein